MEMNQWCHPKASTRMKKLIFDILIPHTSQVSNVVASVRNRLPKQNLIDSS